MLLPPTLHARRKSLTILAFFFTSLGMTLLAQPPAPQPARVLGGHADAVYAVAVSADGRLAATGSFDKSVKLWDAATGKELRTLAGKNGHANQVLCLAFSPNGDTLVSGGSDNAVKVWDVPSPNPASVLEQPAIVSQVAVSPDGKTYAFGLADGSIKIRNATDNKDGPVLKGHAGPVTGLAFSANNQTLTSLGADRTLRQWNVAKGEPVLSLGVATENVTGFGVAANGNTFTASATGQLAIWPPLQPPATKPLTLKAPVQTIAFTPDGKTAAILYADKTLGIVTVNTGKEALKLTDVPADVRVVAISASGKYVAAGTTGGKFVVWGSDGKPRGSFDGHKGEVTAIEYLPSQDIVTAGADGKLIVWPGKPDKAKPPMPAPIDVGKGKVNAIAVPPNGQVVVASADKSVRLVDVAQKKEVKAIGTLAVEAKVLSVSRDGAAIAAGAAKDVKLWNLADGKEVAAFTLPAEVLSLSFGSDRKRLVVGAASNTATVFDLESKQPVQLATHAGPVVGAWCDAVGKSFVTASQDKSITEHPLPAVKVIADPAAVGAALLVTPNGNTVLTAGTGKGVIAWNAGNGTKEKTFETDGAVTALAVTKDGQRLAVAHGAEPTITLFNWNDGTKLGSFKAGGKIAGLAFHPKDPALVGSRADRVVAWNVAFENGQPPPPEFGRPTQELPHPTPVKSLAFTLDGSRIVTASDDKQARLWKFASDQPAKSLPHPNLVDAVAIDKTGTLLATGCHDGILRLWDLTKPPGQPTRAINAHTTPTPQPIYAVVWSPDGKKVATGCFDRTIKIWDAASGNMVKEIKGGKGLLPDPKDKNPPKPEPGHIDQVFTLAFSPNGQFLASGSSDRTIKLWDAAAGTLVREFPNPNFRSPGPGQAVPSHPGFVHALRITADGTKLVSVGTAPRNAGYLAVWSLADGKLLSGQELPLGPIYSCELRGTEALLGCGPKVRQESASEAVFVPLGK